MRAQRTGTSWWAAILAGVALATGVGVALSLPALFDQQYLRFALYGTACRLIVGQVDRLLPYTLGLALALVA
ncbi:MAG TPA: hypothetical protein PK794_11250, partial [Armatimonadota bacterium]|nr:hypothetical protein [Armatimonadota bacterium]